MLEPISLEDAVETANMFLIWSTDTARLELSPEQYRQLTNALTTSESMNKTWDQAYEYLTKTNQESEDYVHFYRKLRNDLKTGSSASGSLIGILSSAIDFSLSNDFENLTEDEKRRVQKFYTEMKEGRIDRGILENASYRHFTGEDYKAGANPKALTLYRISSSQLKQEVVSTVVDRRVVGVTHVGRDFYYNLAEALMQMKLYSH